jgi:hypothetical protein
MKNQYSCVVKVNSYRVNITWMPGFGLVLQVPGTSHYETRHHRTFPQDGQGNVSALDIRRAQDEMLIRAQRALR